MIRSKNEDPAIVLGCHKIGLGIIRALGKAGVPVIGISYGKMDMGTASRYVVRHHTFPNPDIAPQEFVTRLLALARASKKVVLIPSDDASLLCISHHLDALDKAFHVAASPWATIQICIIKKMTYELAEQIGVLCPRTRVPATVDEAVAFASQIGYPCLLKPSIGHRFFDRYRKKMIYLNSADELSATFKTLTQDDIEVMLQEFIPGDDRSGANYNSFYHRGEKIIEVTAEKVRLSPPRIGFPRVVISKVIPEIAAPAAALLRALNYSGFSCMEFKKDARDGMYRLMEINARLNLSSPLSLIAGVNFPYLLYRYTRYGEVPSTAVEYKEGLYWIDPGKDIVESLKHFKNEGSGFRDYVRPYFKPHVYTLFSASDPRPFIKRCGDIAKEAFHRIAGGLFNAKTMSTGG